MSEPKFTPGPWEVGEVCHGDGYSYREISSPLHAFWLARVLAFDVGEDPHHRADARLIVHAPDLYAALDSMTTIAIGLAAAMLKSPEDGCTPTFMDLDREYPSIRAALNLLAKARGEA